MRLKQYSKHKPCYYCGAPPPSTQEHAPPKLMFAAFDCDRITVPSCEKHNTEKAGNDRAVITALIRTLHQTLEHRDSTNSLPENVLKAINFLEPDFHQANRELTSQSLLADPELDFKIPKLNISIFDWIRQLSAAMVWRATGEFDSSIDWSKADIWNALYLQDSNSWQVLDIAWQAEINHASEQIIESSDWKLGWSSTPRRYPSDIYNLKMCFSPPFEQRKGVEVAFRHQFYSCLNWYVWFVPSHKIKMLLEEAAG